MGAAVSVAISRETNEALVRVMRFFGIEDYNRTLFGQAAERAGVDAFSATIRALDASIAEDRRSGVNQRIRAQLAVRKKERKE